MRIDTNDRTRIDEDHQDDLPVTARETRIAKGIEHYELGSAVDAHADTAARILAQNGPAATTPTAPRPNDRVLYVGMNGVEGQWKREAAQLASSSSVIVVQHAEIAADKDRAALGADHIDIGTRGAPNVVDLTTKDGCKVFAASLGLPPAQSDAVANVIHGAQSGRDELAQIAQVWAKAEQGESIPNRLVLSGHSGGNTIYDGDGVNGGLSFASVKELADTLPAAAAQIEDVMISACSSGYDGANAQGRAELSDWSRHFPNLKTAWGYASPDEHHSPSGPQAAMHIGAWEVATRGRTTELHGKQAVDSYFKAQDPAYFESTKRQHHLDAPQFDGNVSTWTSTHGYVEGKG